MIGLDRHIEILLLSNDCVIVPDLGGFMAHHVDARYDEDENMFLPPLRTLGFNPLLKLNDSLLAQSYIEAYDISYPEATRRIEDEVNELKQHLQNDGKYELRDIGTLSLNNEGNYIFEPCEAGILTPELYGLCPFEMGRLATADTAHMQPAAASLPLSDDGILPAPETDATGNGKEETAGINFGLNDTAENEEKDSTIKIKVAWLRNIAAVAAAVIAFFVFTPPVSNSENGQHVIAASSLHGQAIINMMKDDASAKEETDIEPAKIKEAIAHYDSIALAKQALSDKKQDNAIKATATDSLYCIVMASHITRRNADAYVKKLHESGYGEAYTYEHNNIVRVVYGKYENEQDAHAALKHIRGNKYFEQSWVYKRR